MKTMVGRLAAGGWIAVLLAAAGKASGQEAGGTPEGAAGPAAAVTSTVPVRVHISGAMEAWRGDTTYSIGGRIRLPDGQPAQSRDPLSELEFPMDIILGSLAVDVTPASRWEMGARGAVGVTTDAGTVRDRDWGVLPGSDALDIASESDGSLDAWEAEAWCRYRLPPAGPFDLSIGVGYLRQELSYDVSNLVQGYPSSGGSQEPDVEPGLVATYDATFSLPYVEARARADWGRRAEVTIRAVFSPFASVEDEDHHLLRDKVATADDEGSAFMIDGACRYRIGARAFVEGSASYRVIEAEGWQDQSDAGEFIGSIEHRVEQSLAAARLGLGWTL